MIVSFSGKKGVGKDSAAEALIKDYKFKRIGLADELKDICSIALDIPRSVFDDPILKDQTLFSPITLEVSTLTVILSELEKRNIAISDANRASFIAKGEGKLLCSLREALQFIGTDLCRMEVRDDLWLHLIQTKIKEYPSAVITDARFPNERKFLKDLGATLILVKRPSIASNDTHLSENLLGEEDDYDVVITNDKYLHSLQNDVKIWFRTRVKHY